jgi:hypothetical protein
VGKKVVYMCKHVPGTGKKRVLTGIKHDNITYIHGGMGAWTGGTCFNPPLPVKTGRKREGKTISCQHTRTCTHTFPTHVMHIMHTLVVEVNEVNFVLQASR